MSDVAAEPVVLGRRRTRRRAVRNALTGTVFIAPALVLFGLFIAYPVVDTVRLSFFDWDGISPTRLWVGLDNYRELITRDSYFPRAFWNTIIWTAVTVPVQLGLGLAFALALDRGVRFRVAYRSAFFLPAIMSSYVVAFAWSWIYNPEIGVVNGFFDLIGVSRQQWLGEPHAAFWAAIPLSVWRYSGFFMIFFLAGLAMIPTSLYEAARVDGASAWMQLRRITLPMLAPMTSLLVLLGLIIALREFEVIYILTRGGPAHSTDILSIQVFQQAFELSRPGFAAAISTIILGLTAAAAAFSLWLMARAHRSVAS
jgi:raffinose/stachyose/melibiose transport system permease protein